MKTNLSKFSILLASTVLFYACDDDDQATPDVPTAAEFAALQNSALQNITQEFTFDASDGNVSFTSEKGVVISFSTTCLSQDGATVSGPLELEFVEIFDNGSMAATNKTTVGRMSDGNLAPLISGGEFYIRAKKDGVPLDLECPLTLVVPGNLSGAIDTGMSLWAGTINTAGDLVWDEVDDQPQGGGGLFMEGGSYYAFVSDFGWCNIDRFMNDPRPKTTILADVPDGYNIENSSVYVSFDGEGSALASLDTFTAEGYFSEHYGQIPIGIECHLIFLTEDDGIFNYAIKPVTVAAGDIITFSEADMTAGTEAQLIAAINAIQD